jgi:hypothetical protein
MSHTHPFKPLFFFKNIFASLRKNLLKFFEIFEVCFTLVTIMKVYNEKLPKKKLCKHQNLPIITKYESFCTIKIMVTIKAKASLGGTTRNVTP